MTTLTAPTTTTSGPARTFGAPKHLATPLDTDLALSLRDVTVRHPDGTDEQGRPRFHTALDHASLDAARGTLTVVLGPSGSGKSTLLSAAAGLIAPDEGSITVAGESLTGLDDDARSRVRREHIGIVFQQPNLFAALTVMEQLMLPLTLSGMSRRERAARTPHARELLERVGLAGLDDRRPHQLSGGQRQRVAIARALMGSPDLVLVDEPTSALDQEAGARVVDLLVEVTRDLRPATVMVTHDEEWTTRADRVVTVRDGRLGTQR